MIKRSLIVVLVLLAVGGEVVSAGKFRTRLGQSDKVSLAIPHPPDALLRAKSLKVQWEATANAFPKAEQVRLQVQQSLSREFTFTDAAPDAVVKLSLVTHEPIRVREYTQTETRYIKVGEKTTYDKDGKPQKQDVFENREVPIAYWEANGSLNISATVIDKTGTAVDAFSPAAARITRKVVTAENGVSRLGSGSLPTPESLENEMCAQFASQVHRRYTPTIDSVEVMLALDDELRPANKLAQAGRWSDALAQWQTAVVKDKDNQGDQPFNIAVAKEALAYQEYARTQDLEQMMPLFQEAMDLYQKALGLDPKEKYMQSQVARLNLAKTNIQAVRKNYEAQQIEAEKAAEETRKLVAERAAADLHIQELENAKNDTSPDSADEAKFRTMARLRVASTEGEMTPEQRNDLIGLGQRTYKLPEIKSYRVVLQELDRKVQLAQKLKDYEGMFAPLVADGKLTVSERKTLTQFKKDLPLDDSDALTVEAKYKGKFVEDKAVVRVAGAPAAAPTKKPAAVPAKVTTPDSAADKAPSKPGIGGTATPADPATKPDPKGRGRGGV
jgi:tetratricopeptide (TPR) repeat protein